MKKIVFTIIIFISFYTGYVEAGNFGIGLHSGYGVIKYEESISSVDSEATLDTILFGVSGEYSFHKLKNFFAGITTDWAFGFEDEETWKLNDIKIQTNNIKIFGQFYDIRFGYKNSLDRLYYRFYVSGGWDGIHFKRDNRKFLNISIPDSVTEDFSLWRAGVGIGIGYKINKWALDSRVAYSYYPKGTVENSSISGITFDTKGTCFDIGIGVAREILQNMSFYAGGSYTVLKLDHSNMRKGFIFPDSKTQIIAGVVNLTYSF